MAPTVVPTKPLRIVSDSSLPPHAHHSRSLSIQFSPVSPSSPGTPSTPHHDPPAATATTTIPIRWTKELEQRLRFAQKSLEEHQRRWSAGQEDYLQEVETLQELKRRFEKFIRRRSKQHSKEGKRFLRAASVGSSDVETDGVEAEQEDKSQNQRKPSRRSLLRRLSAGMIQRSQSEHGALSTTVSRTEGSDAGGRGFGALLVRVRSERGAHRSMPV